MKSKLTAAQRLQTPSQKHWLVTKATLVISGDYYNKFKGRFVVEAPDIQSAEDAALRIHVPEGFSEEKPFAPWTKGETEAGEWTTVEGFRAFEFSDDHSAVDAGNLFSY